VRHPHFDRHPNGSVEAGKLRAPTNSVKSRMACPREYESMSRFVTTVSFVPDKIDAELPVCFFLDTSVSLF
jgi:hypothetical protein